jgi:hypothetical protein
MFQTALQNVQTMLPQVVCSQIPPFESLIVQSYPQLKVFLANHLYKQEFASLLVDVLLDIMRTHFYSCADLGVGAWLLIHFIAPTFRLPLAHFLTALRTCLGLPHPIIAHFS